ncbi:DUF2325 domain-containing protein [Neobacillus niacini]|uniref:DUF2325 domain-containing protein n=1 Tax=Neobacillus niacini TaxID=86668 RepID=UPI0007AB6E60|nr:DUF2325 domain-containing protein [Neobacillus niacini]MEC1524457.1 DUF2325 domain-containing protein [Neobacillus niacini]
MRTILVIGGKRNKSLEVKARENEMKIMHHPLSEKQKPNKRYFEQMVKKSDCIILFTDACSHRSMWDVRDLSKEHQKPIVYPKGIGTSQALKLAFQAMDKKIG